jgi:glutamine amidotransferase
VKLRVAVVDYGAGNLTSVRKAFTAIGCEVFTAIKPEALDSAAAIVVPGVGHFAATAGIGTEMRKAIATRAADGVPLLGICLGMQWLFEGSTEAPEVRGLAIFNGFCSRMNTDPPLKVPHVGWNTLRVEGTAPLMDGIVDGSHVYFTHSYAIAASDSCTATADHGRPFVAAVQRRSVCGVQFHPEKSGETGLRILRNFASMAQR